jgi:ribosomal protein L11 methyltransferase
MSSTFPALEIAWPVETTASELQEQLHAVLEEFEPQVILDTETADGWRVFFKSAAQREAASAALAGASLISPVVVTSVDVPDDGWARRSQASLTAIRVGRIIVAPPWDKDAVPERPVVVPTSLEQDLAPPPDDIVIVIDPSTGFGTGHHETTRLCLGLMQELKLGGRRVIDAGTGSGVLAIAAWKLGASSVLAFDEDPEALRNARENAARNGAERAIEIVEAALGPHAPPFTPADVVVANLTAGVLQRHSRALFDLVKPQGYLIASGFSADELPEIEMTFGVSSSMRVAEGDWVAAVFEATSPPART